MDTISETLKEKRADLFDEISVVDSEINSLETSLTQAKDKKTLLESKVSKIDSFLTKESELDALFNNKN